jgi:hypothetical protein
MRARFGLLVVIGAAVAVGCGGSSDTTPASYRVAGSVSGLAGTGLVLQNNAGDDVTVSPGAPSFSFPTALADGTQYAVTVKTQPRSPWQTCTVAGGSGTVAGANVTVNVACTTNTYAIAASVSGLAGAGLILSNGTDTLTFDGVGASTQTFATRVASGGSYAVGLQAQPTSPWQTCVVADGSGTVAGADVTVSVACTTDTHAITVTVTGLAGSGLVLANGTDTLSFAPGGASTQTFPVRVDSGDSYAVVTQTQPTNPSQACDVTGGTGSGTVAGADVAVQVTCVTSTFAVAVAVTGLTGSGLVLANGADTLTFAAGGATTRAFATRVVDGGSYAVSFQTQPTSPWQTCAFTGGTGSGTVAGADVTVSVACTTNTYAITTTVAGLAGSGLVLTGTFGTSPPVDSPPLSADGVVPSISPAAVSSGSSYTIAVKTQPTMPIQACTIAGGSSVTGAIANAPVAVAVTCAGPTVVVQRWVAPTTWGGTATSFWPDADPNLVQHATFGSVASGGSYLVETKSAYPANWTGAPGTEPVPLAFPGFPVGTRHAGGPFPTEGLHYQASAPDPSLDIGKVGDASADMLVCAVVKPDYDPIFDGQERPIIAKGVGNGIQDILGGGWVLMQMHDSFCFHYEGWDGVNPASTVMTMVYTPTYFASQDPNHSPNPMKVSPLNPSYLVVCAGRDGNQLRIAVNGYQAGSTFTDSLPPGITRLDAGSSHPLTLGGYDGTTFTTPPPAPKHVFGGRIYETAVWKVPATPDNMQAAFAAVQGLPPGATYTRNREGPFTDPGGGYHTTWRNGPRFDASKGMLFGLQGWNRLSRWKAVPGYMPEVAVYAYGEAFDLWTPANGGLGDPSVVKDTAVMPPGDALTYSQLVTLPGGSSLSTELGAFDAPGTIHGQIWLRVPAAAGTLRIRTTNPALGGSDHFDVNLAGLTPNVWRRVWLHRGSGGDGNELTTSTQPALPPSVFLENTGTTPISFYAWGFDLTQIGGGVRAGSDLGSFDPGLAMYDWGADQDAIMSGSATTPLDVLTLPSVPDTTAASGFCLSVDAQPADGLGWDAPLNEQRNLIAWRHATQDVTARLFVDGGNNAGQLCMTLAVGPGPTPPVSCGTVPAGWTAGSKHTVRGCLSAAGEMRVYAGNVQVGTTTTVPAVDVPDIADGSIRVGYSSGGRPWHGYVSQALVCRDTGDVTECL